MEIPQVAKLAITCKTMANLFKSAEVEEIFKNLIFNKVPHLKTALYAEHYCPAPFQSWKHMAFICSKKFLVLGSNEYVVFSYCINKF